MKNTFLIVIIIFCFVFAAHAQQNGFTYNTSTTSVPLAVVADMREPSPDFDPKLLLLKSAQPMPANEVKQKKMELDLARMNYLQNSKQPSSVFEKTAAAIPVLGRNFAGNVTQGTPNDNDIAISNAGKIISVVNTNFNIFNDTGLYLFGRSLSVFANKLGSLNRTYDPRVIYDPKKDRFIIVFLQGSSSADTRIILAFSQTNDPTAKWNFYVLPGNLTNDSNTWSDYPIVALTDDELFVTVNRVKDNTPWQQGFIESYIWQIDKQKGYDSAAVLPVKNYNNIKLNGKSIWNICPAKGGSTTHGPNMYFVSVRPSDLQNDTVFLHEITNTLASGNAQLTLKILRTDKKYGLMPNAIQPSGKRLQTNDARVLSACYEEGFLYYVANTIDTVKFSPSVYYGRIKNVNTASPLINGIIISSDTMDFGYPSLTYTGSGVDDRSVMLTFSFVSKKLFPGTAAMYVDRNGNLSPLLIVKNGESNIALLSDSVERWGDYTGIQRKYNDSTYCWLNGSYGYQNGNKTWIAKVKNADAKFIVNEVSKHLNNSKLFPNPSSEYVFVDFEMNENMILEFEIMDINGRLVNSILRDKGKEGTNRFSFRVNDLNDGIYFLTIKNENKIIQSKKFVVAR